MFAKVRDIQLLFTFTSSSIFILLSDTFTGILVPAPGLSHVLMKICVFGTFALLCNYLFRPSFLDTIRQVRRNKKWYMLFPAALCFFFFLSIQGQGPLYSLPKNRPIALFLCFCALCVYISYFLAFTALRHQYKAETDKSILMTQIQAFENHFALVTRRNEQIALFRHDFRHFYLLQSACLQNKDVDGAIEALQYVFQNMEQISRELTVKLQMPHTPTDSVEFSVVLSNALENAYHACQKQPEGEKRSTHLLGHESIGKLYLDISNTYSDEVSFNEEGLPKSCCEGHGYGTKSISYFVSKSNGQVKFFTQDHWFHLQMILKLGTNPQKRGSVKW